MAALMAMRMSMSLNILDSFRMLLLTLFDDFPRPLRLDTACFALLASPLPRAFPKLVTVWVADENALLIRPEKADVRFPAFSTDCRYSLTRAVSLDISAWFASYSAYPVVTPAASSTFCRSFSSFSFCTSLTTFWLLTSAFSPISCNRWDSTAARPSSAANSARRCFCTYSLLFRLSRDSAFF